MFLYYIIRKLFDINIDEKKNCANKLINFTIFGYSRRFLCITTSIYKSKQNHYRLLFINYFVIIIVNELKEILSHIFGTYYRIIFIKRKFYN